MATKPIPTAPSASNLSFMSRNISFNNDYVWPQAEPPKIRNSKAILAQCLAVLPIFLIHFNTEINSTIYNLLPIDRRDIYYNVAHVAGLIVGGVAAQIIGGRLIITLGAAVLFVGWLSLQWVSSVLALLWTLRVLGFTSGMTLGPSYVYLAEIAQPKLRGVLMATVNLSLVLGKYLDWHLLQTQSLTIFKWINIIFPIVGLITIIILPESPYWLATKGRYERAESSLAWFRGWTTPSSVKSESTAIINHAQNNLSTLKLFQKNSIYISFTIVIYVFAVKVYSGIYYLTLLMLYSLQNNQVDLPFIVNVGYIVCPIIFFVAVAIISKRILILVSLFGVSFTLLLAIAFNVLNDNDILIYQSVSTLLPISLAIAILFFHFGIVNATLLLNGELFPSRLRYVGAGIGLFVMQAFEYGSTSIYSEYITHPPFTLNISLSILASLNLFGFISLCWLFPKNENKTMVEIEQSCNSINNLRKNDRQFRTQYLIR